MAETANQNPHHYLGDANNGESFTMHSGAPSRKESNPLLNRTISKTSSATNLIRNAILSGVNRGARMYSKRFVEIATVITFVSLLFLLVLTAIFLSSDDKPQPTLENLIVDLTLIPEEINVGESKFYSLKVPNNKLIALFAQGDSDIDTTIEVADASGTVIAFNDDVSSDNPNPLVFLSGHEEELDVIIEVGTFEDRFQGTFVVGAVTVENHLQLNSLQTFDIDAASFFISTIDLLQGVTYHFYALGEDTAIRIRDSTGDPLIQVFQSTLQQFECHLVFTPPETGIYIVEIREVQDPQVVQVQTLVTTAEIDILDFESIDAIKNLGEFEMMSASSRLFQFTAEANNQYTIEMNLELTPLGEANDDIRVFGPVFYYTEVNGYADLGYVSTGIIEGLNMKLYDKQGNTIELRTRTDFDVEKSEKLPKPDDLDLGRPIRNIAFLTLTPIETVFNILVLETTTFLLDVSTMFPIHVFQQNGIDFDEEVIGTYSIVVSKKSLSQAQIESESSRVDENNLFAQCNVDQTKYTIDDGCETSVALFCRHQFFPDRDPVNATIQDFANICNCIEFLCATLPSGGDVSVAYRTGFNVAYGLFATVSIICFLFYTCSTLDLIVYGGFREWLSRGFGTWTISGLFFLVSFLFFVTQIQLSKKIGQISEIADNFDLNQIIAPSDNLGYLYYDKINVNLIGIPNVDLGEEDNTVFLNEQALEQVPSDTSFETLRSMVITNVIAFVLLQAFAVIGFLDISVVWIESSRAASLNRKLRRQQFRKFKYAVRIVEILYSITLMIITIQLEETSGQSYSLLNSILVFFLSSLIIVLYFMGRHGLRGVLGHKSDNLTFDPASKQYWFVIRNVSTVVIAANLGVVLVQLYFMVQVQNFNELVQANNDTIVLSLLLFQYICIFAGQLAVFIYLAGVYQKFRSSLFENTEEDSEKSREPSVRAEFIRNNTPKNTGSHPEPGKTANSMFDSEISGVI